MCSKPTDPDAASIFDRTFEVLDKGARALVPAQPVPITVPTLGEVEALMAENEVLRQRLAVFEDRPGVGQCPCPLCVLQRDRDRAVTAWRETEAKIVNMKARTS